MVKALTEDLSPRPCLAVILAKLSDIEGEMRRIGYWSENPPDLRAAAERGEIRTYLDAPTFELWLQALFLPNAREAVAADELPDESEVGMMAQRQYDYQSSVPEAQTLIQLLREFDRLVVKCARKKRSPR